MQRCLQKYFQPKYKGEQALVKCPFCQNYQKDKLKLQINVDSGQWHCWVCDMGGKTFDSFLNQLVKIKFIDNHTKKLHSISKQPIIRKNNVLYVNGL